MSRTLLRTALLVTAFALVAAACGGDDDDAESAPAGPEGTVSVDDLSRGHTTDDVEYEQSPPVGGDHDPRWQNCGVYRDPIRDENAVHVLEHGGVWVSYQPDLAAADVQTLEALAEGQTHVLVAPYDGLADPVVLTAWGKQLTLDAADDARINEFLDDFLEGPQTPEPGAPCTGGIGTPVDA